MLLFTQVMVVETIAVWSLQIKFLLVRKYDVMPFLRPSHVRSSKTKACFFSQLIKRWFFLKFLKKLGDRRGAEADELVVLKAHLDMQNGVQKQTADNKEKTRKKSDKNMNNYRKIVVADNDGTEEKYKNDYRGRVQDRNVTIVPQPMFVLTYYEKPNDVKRQVYYYKYIDELNSQHTYPEALLITNEEAALTEAQANKHFASIDEQTSAIVANPNDVHKRFARALDFYLVQDLDNALTDLNEAIKCEPHFFLPYFNRAVVRYKQMEYQKVVQDLEKKDKDGRTHSRRGASGGRRAVCWRKEWRCECALYSKPRAPSFVRGAGEEGFSQI